MKERTIYIGEGTEVAAQMRDIRIRRGLGAGPLSWLATAFGLILGERVQGPERQAPAVVDFSRRTLVGLGFDPDTHRLAVRKSPTPGVVVRDAAGEPCGFFSEKQLLKLAAEDPAFGG